MTREEAEAEARAKVLESAAKVEKLLADIRATMKQLRDAGVFADDNKSPH